MQTSSSLRRESSSAPVARVIRTQGGALPVDAMHEAANDDATSTGPEYRPNPLWAVNGAMAAFFIVAAIALAGD